MKLADLQPTAVFDSYWRFACERQLVYMRRVAGEGSPWTDDSIISKFRFTNVYRACDRVSQYLLRHVIYDKEHADRSDTDTVLRILLFKLFNRIETWRLLEASCGDISAKTFSAKRIGAVLDKAMARKDTVYSAAYIIPPIPGVAGRQRKHHGHLRLLEKMLADSLPMRVANAGSLADIYALLIAYPGFGPFLAFQFAIDLNYSPVVAFDEMSFVVAGPGARSGITKCFASPGRVPPEDIIRMVAEAQHQELERRGLRFPALPGRDLQLIDCQNLFCETDKYARVAHPEIVDAAGRSRIKQSFRPAGPVSLPIFPPRWRVGDVATLAKKASSWTSTTSRTKQPRQTSILGQNLELDPTSR